MPPTGLDLHGLVPASYANGPGRRFVIWFQGCTLGCRGCFNPETHAAEPRLQLRVSELLSRIARAAPLEGVSVSGGEPFQQPQGLLALLAGLRATTRLSSLAFSGYTLEEIQAQPLGPPILAELDVLIAGRYLPGRRRGRGLLGSSNQKVHLLTSRYRIEEIEATPAAEVILGLNGSVTVTGIDPPRG